MSETVSLPITETTQVGEARRIAVALARRVGFGEEAAGKAALIVTELANNLVKHAHGGELLLLSLEQDRTAGLEVQALDKGPGMDLSRCLRDGYSTAGTPGTGLGAVVRQSAFFDLHSSPSSGTALLARLWSGPKARNGPAHEAVTGSVSLPLAGETVCGDGWAMERRESRHLFLIADGLGHGPLAASAAREAVRVFHANAGLEPVPILQAIHAALRSTRGAAVALADIDFTGQVVRFAGVGNIAGTVATRDGTWSMVSHNGTAGHLASRFQEFVYPFPPGALLVMHSDGLTGRWRLDEYPGLSSRDPALIAGVLYRDHKRGRDDVTVLVVREAGKDGSPP